MFNSSDNDLHSRIAENLRDVRQRINAACARRGSDSHSVQLVGVTKYTPLDRVRQLVRLGQTALGESRPQQLIERAEALDSGIEWHLIGHLQRNKARLVLPYASLIHSIDSLRLLKRVDQVAGEAGLKPRLLLQVNVSGERTKDGFPVAEIEQGWPDIAALKNVDLRGLMTMAPLTQDVGLVRNVFRGLRSLRDRLAARSPGLPLPELSMGMSGDFEIAIEEGATIIRLGSILFEGCEATSLGETE